MTMIHGENFKIMVGGQKITKKLSSPLPRTMPAPGNFSDPWRTPDIKQSWDISCDAMVRDAGDVLRDLLNGQEKWDVTIGQEVGKLPRKMKKALHSKRMTKWKHKVASYINRREVRIHDAEMVVTPDHFDTLEGYHQRWQHRTGCVVPDKQISEA